MKQTGTENSSLSIKWRWLPLGYSAEYIFSCDLNRDLIRDLAKQLLQDVLPARCRSDETITDLKGRDRGPATGNTPQREELFFISGESIHADADKQMEDSRVPFEAALYTKFLRFDGARHIVHTVQKYLSGTDAENTPMIDQILDPKNEITTCRLGLEFFEARAATLIGFSPVVTQTLLVECSATRVMITIVGEGMATKKTMPLSNDDTFAKLSKVWQRVFEIDLEAAYQSKLG